ncbi:SIS domain-containing protein [Caldithrix abyssi]|uniref:Galactosamine 6-phosphate isomerase AgaS n=1 Tax=Caldithrix abyssi DSM 13497 TaxID=880073 RepID=A0A1J1C6W7_CALAY|nr:SIS domain-containing protein [Caldithrix abyssi]APF18437.1 galactosamine 6-phosphate isomerase AgaS [Caldithrix abyssi DSM 13497]
MKGFKLFPDISYSDLKDLGALNTGQEIAGQPELWLKTFQFLTIVKDELRRFLDPLFQKPGLQILFTGAGTSAFIGEVLQGVFQKNLGLVSRAVATTDIVTHPEYYFLRQTPTLLISFARSGNSPESIKTVELANEFCDDIHHLIITCNANGHLAQKANPANSFVFLLPPEANDQSLAMTGSFTSMLLSGLLISRLDELHLLEGTVETLADYGHKVLSQYALPIKQAAQLPFKRAVFLGSGIFQGVARESHLKLQELTDGKVICKFDTFLGFRHGPKAVIDSETLMVYIFSNRRYPQLYEMDLVKSIYRGQKGIFGIAISESELPGIKPELKIILNENHTSLGEEFLTVVSVLPAQMLGFYKSLFFDLEPDQPSVSGAISRVVQGVKLYPYEQKLEKA